LIDQTYNEILDYDCSRFGVKKINYQTITEEQNVKGEVIKFSKNVDLTTGQILLITHATFFALEQNRFKNRSKWILLIDEIPLPFQFIERNLSESCDIITQHLRVKKSTATNAYCILKCKNEPESKKELE